MVVAVGALQPHAQEHLADVLGLRPGVARDAAEVRRPDLIAVAEGQHQLARHAVQRRVAGDLVADPGVERRRPVGPESTGLDPQQVAPLVRPVIDELGAEPGADRPAGRACPARVGQEAVNLLGIGSCPVRSSRTRRR